MFLADAVAGYVASLTERELDAPLIALLHHHGFTNVHLVHGAHEYGQDIIARRDEDGAPVQYCFQSKAGDLGVAGWRDVRQQVHAMRTGTVVHPDFDPSLARRLVVVINGRLKGAAGVEFQNDNAYYASRGETVAELWDLDYLVPRFEEVLVEGVPAQSRARTLELLGRFGQGAGTRTDVREFSREWFAADLTRKERWGHILTGAMLARAALESGREDLSAQIAYVLLRRAREYPAVAGAPDEGELAAARRLFEVHASTLWAVVKDTDALDLTTRSATGFDAFVTHPVQAARLCECLAQLWLLATQSGRTAEADDIAAYVASLVARTPAVAHVVSDEWAFSLLVTATMLACTNRAVEAEALLREAAIWLLDKIEYGKGIAGSGQPAEVAVRQLLGPAFPTMGVRHHPATYALAVVIDLAYVCGFRDLYRDLVHDRDAVDAMATIVVQRPGANAELVARIAYSLDGDLPAPHHAILSAIGDGVGIFDEFGTWATMRDRHTPGVISKLLASRRREAQRPSGDNGGAGPSMATAG